MMLEDLINARQLDNANGYYITRDGRVFKIQEMSQFMNNSGYMYVSISTDEGHQHRSVHREVAKAFIPNDEGLDTVDHIDGDKTHNHEDNLQWMSKGDNLRKAFERQVHLIHDDGRVCKTSNVRRFAREYGIDSSALSKVIKGKQKHTGGWRLLSDGQ